MHLHSARVGRTIALLFVMALGPSVKAGAQIWFPPGSPLLPRDVKECVRFQASWDDYFARYSRDHEECLAQNRNDTQRSSGKDETSRCSVPGCQRLHDKVYGDEGFRERRRMKEEVQSCYQEVAAYNRREAERKLEHEQQEKAATAKREADRLKREQDRLKLEQERRDAEARRVELKKAAHEAEQRQRDAEAKAAELEKAAHEAEQRQRDAEAKAAQAPDAAQNARWKQQAEDARRQAAQSKERAALAHDAAARLAQEAQKADAERTKEDAARAKQNEITKTAEAKQAEAARAMIADPYGDGKKRSSTTRAKIELSDPYPKNAPVPSKAPAAPVVQSLQKRVNALSQLRTDSDATFDGLVAELEKGHRSVVNAANNADTAAEVALILYDLQGIAKKGFESLKLKGKALDELNREATKETLEFASRTPAEMASKVRAEKAQAGDGLATAVVLTAVKSWSDMNSPSFWDTFATTWLNDSAAWWDPSRLSKAVSAGTQGPEALLLQAKARIEAQRQQTNRAIDAKIAETQRILKPASKRP